MPHRLKPLFLIINTTVQEYWASAVLGMSSVTLATMWEFLPEPENFVKAIVLAIVTGFFGGLGKWISKKVVREKDENKPD
jgi:hypothetical protein